MGTKHDLTDYAFSKDVVKDFPVLIQELDKLALLLYKYEGYMAVDHLLSALQDSTGMMAKQLRDAKAIVNKKGQV